MPSLTLTLYDANNQPIEPKPFFKKPGQYRAFSDSFDKQVRPDIERNEEARARSIENSMHHMVD
ncbi:hypothetical protein HOD75_02615 [archaeon]|jgi:hypothetical protein|nr:hypothetical protein [archaeon]MBT4241769.1 hypothetical protein [archaeon]MBT4418317.1 hypothetical protein [archaeon]